MPLTASPERRALAWGLAAIAAVTLWRLALLPFDAADLFVDDAQYWFWGQDLNWGYYSKPPLIAWILRLATEIGGDGALAIRAPLPLIHAATACVMVALGTSLLGPRTGALAGVLYATLPGVAVGSLLVSTDTPMLFFFAAAMLAQRALAAQRSVAWAIALGACVGLGLLAKYAMIYFLPTACLAALCLREARIGWRDAGIAAGVALLIVAPNLAWNVAHDFTTLQHTADNADWEGPRLDAGALAVFLANQFAVAGPVVLAASLFGAARAGRGFGWSYAAAMSLPVLAIVCIQALVSGANANWAAAAHLGLALLAASVLQARRGLLAAGLGINLAVTLILPVAAVQADRWTAPSGDLLLARYVGRADVSRRWAALARDAGLDTLVASDRSFLADAFHTLRASGLVIHAEPVAGFPPHHYAQRHPLPAGPGEVLYLTADPGAPSCRAAAPPPVEIARWTPERGFITKPIRALRVARSCWHPAP